MASNHIVRMRSAEIRNALIHNRAGHGEAMGDAIARRIIWECAEDIAEAHDRAFATEQLYRVADAFVRLDALEAGVEAATVAPTVDSTTVTVSPSALSEAITAGVIGGIEATRPSTPSTRAKRFRAVLEANTLSFAALCSLATALVIGTLR